MTYVEHVSWRLKTRYVIFRDSTDSTYLQYQFWLIKYHLLYQIIDPG